MNELLNHVVAIIKSRESARALLRELTNEGFPQSRLLDATGMETQVDPMGEESSGLLEHAVKTLQSHISEEPSYLAQYMEEARAGSHVIAVKVDAEEQVAAIKDVLARHGAENIRFFGRFAVTDLTPESNPSARSDQLP